MERFDIKMLTSPWGKRYADYLKGSWMPLIGAWNATDGWRGSNNVLQADGNINPAPLVLIVSDRIRDKRLRVRMTYKTASFVRFDSYTASGRVLKHPVYEHDQEKVVTFSIPRFTDVETIFRIATDDNLIYEITNIEILSSTRGQEGFTIHALASPTSRLIFGQNWHVMYENLVAIKRGIWSAPTPCGTCGGTGLLDSSTCPECEGWGFSGSQAMGYLLDQKARDVDISKAPSTEDSEHFRNRIWSRKWWVIPTKEEIVRYFKHFCHVDDDDILVYEIEDNQEPTFFVCVDPDALGSKALWEIGDTYENYDGLVERITPAGVNGYFDWLTTFTDTVDTSTSWLDDSTDQLYGFLQDIYGSYFDASMMLVNAMGEPSDAFTACSGIFAAWETFEDDTIYHPVSFGDGPGEVETLSSLHGHNMCGACDSRKYSYIEKKGAISGQDSSFSVDFYMAVCRYGGFGFGGIELHSDSSNKIQIGYHKTPIENFEWGSDGDPVSDDAQWSSTTPADTSADLKEVSGNMVLNVKDDNAGGLPVATFTLDSPSPATPGSYQVRFFIKQNATANNTTKIGDAASIDRINVWFHPTNGRIYVDESGSSTLVGNSLYTVGEWVEVIVRTSGNDNFYLTIDGTIYGPYENKNAFTGPITRIAFESGSGATSQDYYVDDIGVSWDTDSGHYLGVLQEHDASPTTIISGAEPDLMKWYHVHAEVDIDADTIDMYVNGEYDSQVTGLSMETHNYIALKAIGDNCVVVDAIDGSWDSNYWKESNGSTCKTRNMFQRGHAPDFDNSTYDAVLPTITSENNWVQGLDIVTVDNFEWIPIHEGRQNVMKSPNFSFDLGSLPSVLTYYYWSDNNVVEDFTSGYEGDHMEYLDNWGFVTDPDGNCDFLVETVDGVRTMHIDDLSTTNSAYIRFTFPEASPQAPDADHEYVVTFRYITNNSRANNTNADIYFGDAGNFSRFWITVHNWNGYHYHNGPTKLEDLGSYSEDTWYEVQVAVSDTVKYRAREVGGTWSEWDDNSGSGYPMSSAWTGAITRITFRAQGVYSCDFNFTKIKCSWVSDDEARWIYRRVNAGNNWLTVRDDHELVSASSSTSTTYTINHDYVCGVTLNDHPWRNTHGGTRFPSTRKQLEVGDEWTINGATIGIVDTWKGMSFPVFIGCDNEAPQYIKDTKSISVDSTWSCYLWLDPYDDSEFKIEFHAAAGISFPLVFKRGDVLDDSGNVLGWVGNRKWFEVKVYWDISAHTYDLYVDGTSVATGTAFQNNNDPITHINIGWMNPGTINVGDVAYIAGIRSWNEPYVDESGTEGVDGTTFKFENAISQKLYNYDAQNITDAQTPSYWKLSGHDTSNILSLFIQDDEKYQGTDSKIVHVGDMLRTFHSRYTNKYRATENFSTYDDDETPDRIIVTEDTNSTMRVSSHLGRNKVLYANVEDTESVNAVDWFGAKDEGMIELWMCNDSYTSAGSSVSSMSLYKDSTPVISLGHANGNGEFRYKVGAGSWSSFDNTPSFDDRYWHHVKVYWDGSSTIANVWYDGAKLKVSSSADIDFSGTGETDVNKLRLDAVGPVKAAFDAIGYSWDEEYAIGMNLSHESKEISESPLPAKRWVDSSTSHLSEKPLDFLHYPVDILYNGAYTTNYDDFSGSNTIHELVDGHLCVLELSSSGSLDFDQGRTSGTVEFWAKTENFPYYVLRDGASMAIRITYSSGLLFYGATRFKDVNGDDVEIDNNTWSHFKIVFDCDTDTYNMYLNGSLLYDNSGSGTDIPFDTNVDEIDNFLLQGASAYIDAFDMSWADNYSDSRSLFDDGKEVSHSISLTNGMVHVKGRHHYVDIKGKDRVMVISKGLNTLHSN